jgi:pimeloyl-ACP methyl ester carboxylesterase
MPFANVNSVRLNYEILGDKGPWVALVSGARRNMDEVRGLATLVANSGFQVLLHDRRNTGQSSLSLEGEGRSSKSGLTICARLRCRSACPG